MTSGFFGIYLPSDRVALGSIHAGVQVWGLVPLVLSCWLDRLWSLPSLFFVVFAFLVVRLVSGPWRCDERLLWHLFALGPSCLGQCVCRCGPFVRGQTLSKGILRKNHTSSGTNPPGVSLNRLELKKQMRYFFRAKIFCVLQKNVLGKFLA